MTIIEKRKGFRINVPSYLSLKPLGNREIEALSQSTELDANTLLSLFPTPNTEGDPLTINLSVCGLSCPTEELYQAQQNYGIGLILANSELPMLKIIGRVVAFDPADRQGPGLVTFSFEHLSSQDQALLEHYMTQQVFSN